MSREIPDIKKNVDLTFYNTLGVSAVAGTFVEIESKEELTCLHKRNFFKLESPFILGGGSNILFLKDPSSPVLKVSIQGIEKIHETPNRVSIKIGAGENWHDFVTWAVHQNFGGVENLALIPGTVGAAPIQNIGAYGVELKEVFNSLECFDIRDGSFKIFDAESCKFEYRDSIFKHALKGKIIVTSVTLNLTKKNHRIENSYNALNEYLLKKGINTPTIKDVYKAVINIRTSKLPDPELIGNAGSFFKNPVIGSQKMDSLKENYNEIPFYKIDDTDFKIPAAWLIEKTGWKGRRIGDVGTYKNQALVIVNHGNATGSEIFDFSKQIRKSVQEEFGIELVPEVNIVK